MAQPLTTQMLEELIRTTFPQAGLNKVREIVRLVYEISKRERVSPESILTSLPAGGGFPAVKRTLLRRRFPELSHRGVDIHETFSALELVPDFVMDLSRAGRFDPLQILIEQGEERSPVAHNLIKAFPSARIETIENYRMYLRDHPYSVNEYNLRTDTVFVVREKYDFIKSCPCTPGVRGCGYNNMNLGFGCPYECSYCFLQNYTNAPGIVLPANLDDFFQAMIKYKPRIRVGSGEMTDSLVFDHLTGFSPRIVDFFRRNADSAFEFKTKSSNINLLLTVQAVRNIVVAWSVNPQSMIAAEEHGTAPLDERLLSSRRCAQHGYSTAFHFDPIFYYSGWEKEYRGVVDKIFAEVPAESIVWISLGTLRMTAEQKKMIENRFPDNTILDAELLTAPDGKIRYHQNVRLEIYTFMRDCILRHSRNVPIYLCMEPIEIWKSAGINLFWAWG